MIEGVKSFNILIVFNIFSAFSTTSFKSFAVAIDAKESLLNVKGEKGSHTSLIRKSFPPRGFLHLQQ